MIPEFLKHENVPRTENRMFETLKKYEAHFGKSVTTECSSYTEEEWVEILEYCIANNEPLEEDEIDEDTDI